MKKPSASKKRVAAKKPASSGKAQKPAARTTAKSSSAKAALPRSKPTEPARPVDRYEPRQIEGIGWKPFRYPPE